ncbi:MAG: DUF2780 domain-containing protein [Hahellaceae bacterium]|nr:DUF2780 domain-containing protein [Hahellaceae bacterium]
MIKQGILAVLLAGVACNGLAAGLGDIGAALDKASSVTKSAANTTQTATATSASDMSGDLVGMAVSQLGLTETQAQGGLGSLFGLAKSNLSGDEFGQIASAVPNMDTLLAAVPALTGGESSSGGLGGLAGSVASLAGGSDLMKQFSALGISPDMIKPLAELAMQFLGQSGQSGGTDLSGLLLKGLGGLLG